MSKQILKFPSGFLWGTSTSAYQVEGGIINDWSQWEEKNADRLVEQAKSYWQPWQQKRFPEMFNRDNYLCAAACKSYELFNEDIKCLKEINCSAYRLGVEWARIEPEAGEFDKKAIEHYRLMLKTLKENKIKVVLTLWHWTNPIWLVKAGGWESKKVREYFNRYVQLIVNELGDLVDFWVTLNEPLMLIGHGYLDGKFPPNKKFSPALFKVFNNLVAVHKNCYKIIHHKYPSAPVSVTMTSGAFTAANKYNPIERLMVKLANYFRNDWYLNRVKGYFDYVGVNWYHHDRLVWYPPFRKNLNEKITDRGWEIYPEGIYLVLRNYQKHKKPIYVLENGIADADDKLRPDFIRDHLSYVHRAIAEGVDVRGYFYWSLLDNFEWAEGYWPKFGLYAVDRKTFKRTARPSAKVYAQICKNNGVELDQVLCVINKFMPYRTNFGDLPKANSKLETSKIVILPVPYDRTSTWGKGADKGPEAIIEASANMELYDIETDAEVYKQNIFTAQPVIETGAPETMVKKVKQAVSQLLQQEKFVVILGGEHSITAGAVSAYAEKFKDLSVLQLDAHSDLRPEYQGSKYSHACAMSRVREICPIVQVGIRSLDIIEKPFIDQSRVFFAEKIYNKTDWLDKAISKLTDKVYITIDLDVFDPGILPSTGTPEPGGLGWYQILEFLKKVNRKKQIVGFDIVELCPNKNERSSDFLAAKLVYKLLSYIFKK